MEFEGTRKQGQFQFGNRKPLKQQRIADCLRGREGDKRRANKKHREQVRKKLREQGNTSQFLKTVSY